MATELEIICVGNELLIGKIKDTNAHYIATQATKLGAHVTRITVIQDVIEEIAAAIHEAQARNPHFIIMTGGLGPTFDDKTFQGIAVALNRKLVVDETALEWVKQQCIEYARKRQLPIEIKLTPPRLKMATFPENTQPVCNPVGTAPALRAELETTTLFALPGVPMETEAIFDQSIAPQIKEAVGRGVFCQRSIFVEDLFESNLAPLIDRVMSDYPGVYVKSHPLRSESRPRLEIHLTINDSQDAMPMQRLLKASEELSRLIEGQGGKVRVEV